MRRRVEKLGDLYRELEASVYDAHAIATGVVRLASADEPAPPEAVAAIEAAAGAVKAIEPAEARHSAGAAHEAARRLREADSSLGAAVVAHGVVGVADHTQRAAEAREEERKLGESRKRRSPFR
jgi:hypothetical protein